MTLHPFEKAGLGKAPFHCVGVEDNDSHCQFCGTPIRYRYYIHGEDGSEFHVGSDCVNKTGGDQYIGGFRAVRLLYASRHSERFWRVQDTSHSIRSR